MCSLLSRHGGTLESTFGNSLDVQFPWHFIPAHGQVDSISAEIWGRGGPIHKHQPSAFSYNETEVQVVQDPKQEDPFLILNYFDIFRSYGSDCRAIWCCYLPLQMRCCETNVDAAKETEVARCHPPTSQIYPSIPSLNPILK